MRQNYGKCTWSLYPRIDDENYDDEFGKVFMQDFKDENYDHQESMSLGKQIEKIGDFYKNSFSDP